MAYLFYTYCDQNSSTSLSYIKTTYQGNLSLQQEAYWSGRKAQYNKLMNEHCLGLSSTLLLPTTSSDTNPHDKSFENHRNCIKSKKYGNSLHSQVAEKVSYSDLNPLAVPFNFKTEKTKETIQRSTDIDKRPAQLVLFEPGKSSSQGRSCQIIHQRMHHRPRENWDECEPTKWN